MSQMNKTVVFCVVAVLLAAVAFLTAPRRVTPEAFMDQGEPFFPEFTDPNAAATLEVVDFNEETGTAVPFKVTFEGGIWTIPSHHGYPADAKDRLAKTAAGIIEIRKDDFRTDNAADHEACGVIDPLDQETAALSGRGQRVTIKGPNEVVLADLIFGKPVEGGEGMRFVRVPGQKRVYAARVDVDISTKFGDWIERDLLEVGKDEIEYVLLRNYTINERTKKVEEGDRVTLEKHGEWTMPGLKKDEEIAESRMNDFLGALDQLSIEGVRPKPAGLSASLTRASEQLTITTSDLLSLQDKGYFFSKDGKLLSNEGELQARTTSGLTYILRFGEVVYGTGLAITAGTADQTGEGGPGENRYLFVTVSFDPSYFPEPPRAPNTSFLEKPDSLWTDEDRTNKGVHDAHAEWANRVSAAKKRADELNARFASWYYVISGQSFEKLRPSKSDLIQKKA